MYSTSNGQRRGLLRPHSSHSGPVFRNLPLFGFLAGLVLFFYIFYIYQAQNAELNLAREENELQIAKGRELAGKITELSAQLEKARSDLETNQDLANKEKSSLEEKVKGYSVAIENQKAEISRMENEKKDYAEKLQTVKLHMEQLNDTLAAMRTVTKNNEETISRLNTTIIDLQEQLRKAQSVSNTGAINNNDARLNSLNVANKDSIQERISEAKNNLKFGNVAKGDAQNERKFGFSATSKGEVGNVPVAKQDSENVIAAPVIIANDSQKAAGDGNIENAEKKSLNEGVVEKVEDGAEAANVARAKDYRNSAEEAKLRIEENKLKPNMDALDFDNDERRN